MGHTVAVDDTGRVWFAGYAGDVETVDHFTQVAGRHISSIAGGPASYATIDTDATLRIAAVNNIGMLGRGRCDTRRRIRPAIVARGIADVALSWHGAAITVDGQLLTWGANNIGQLGFDPGQDSPPRPVQAPTLPSGAGAMRSVAAGSSHTVAIDDTGRMWASGGNAAGQLGCDGTLGHRRFRVTGDYEPATAVTAVGETTYLLSPDGQLRGCGSNRRGQLGIRAGANYTRPIELDAPSAVTVSVSSGAVAVIDTSGRIWVAGAGLHELVGCGFAFTEVPAPFRAVDVACGDGYLVAVDDQGALWAVGSHPFGATGCGTAHAAAFQRIHTGSHAALAAQLASPGVDFDAAYDMAVAATT
jgi:alpha-tubulin suppressor-like RCC1 family protein